MLTRLALGVPGVATDYLPWWAQRAPPGYRPRLGPSDYGTAVLEQGHTP